MLKINDERNPENKHFDELNCGDFFIDPDDNDVCIKINDCYGENNSFSFNNCIPFPMDPDVEVIPIHEVILTIK